jgi:drug/metabolite transporter (DMT)-like permease
VSILLALLSSFCAAANLLTQRVSSRGEKHRSAWRLALSLVRNPLWLIGAAAAVAAFLLQAAALHFGSLSIVQPVLVTELIFVLVLRRIWLHQSARVAAWGSAGLVCASLGLFLAVGEPRGGHDHPTTAAWLGTLAAFGGATVLLVVLAIGGSPARRAALYATASAFVGALEAAYLKSAADTLAAAGVKAMLTHWPVYAVALCGIVDVILVQAALHVGPLSVSQPLMVVVTPLASIALSVWLFEEHFTHDVAAITAAALSFAGIVVGVVMLTRTGPRGSDQPGHPVGTTPPAGLPDTVAA